MSIFSLRKQSKIIIACMACVTSFGTVQYTITTLTSTYLALGTLMT
jgi:hypothetical protein